MTVQLVAVVGAAAREPLLRAIVLVPATAVSVGSGLSGLLESLQVVLGAALGGYGAISNALGRLSVKVIPVSAPPVTGFVMVILNLLALGYDTGEV